MSAHALTQRLYQLSSEIAKRQVEFSAIKDRLREQRNFQADSLDGLVTVYRVKKSVVKQHTRRGYSAVRVTVRR